MISWFKGVSERQWDVSELSHNHGQNLWSDDKKSSKIGQDEEILVFIFAEFLTTNTKVLFLEGEWVLGENDFNLYRSFIFKMQWFS